MTKTEVLIGQQAKSKLKEGVDLVANATKVTFGAKGRNVLIKHSRAFPHITKDGVTVSNWVGHSDPTIQAGVLIAQEASQNTNKSVGDGTTNVLVLTQSLIDKGLRMMRKGYNSVEIKRGMEKAGSDVKEILTDLSVDVSKSKEKLRSVATISANGDESMGSMIADLVFKTGIDGDITVERSVSGKNESTIVDGMRFDSGWNHYGFITNWKKRRAELSDVAVLICSAPIDTGEKAIEIMNGAKQLGKSLLVLGKTIEGEAYNAFISNHQQGNINVCVAKIPDFGNNSEYMIEDIAAFTGAKIMSVRKGNTRFNPNLFGLCDHVQVDEDKTIMKGGRGDTAEINKRCEDIKAQIEESNIPAEKEFFKTRLARLAGGVGVIRIYTNSEVETNELKDRVDDAIHATLAAMMEGVVAGGGVALKHCYSVLKSRKQSTPMTAAESIGYKIVLDSLMTPYFTILKNAGVTTRRKPLLTRLFSYAGDDMKYPNGINVKTNERVDMIEAGIIDPTKVIRVCLENAVSISATFLTTEAAIIVTEEEPNHEKRSQ